MGRKIFTILRSKICLSKFLCMVRLKYLNTVPKRFPSLYPISQTQDDMDDKSFAISFSVLMFLSDIGRKFNSVQFHFSCEINFLGMPW